MEKKSQCHCASYLTAKQRFLAIGLLLISLLGSVWFVGLTFQDLKRYELHPLDTGADGTAAYKLDTKTGKVVGIYNLFEFNVEPFEDQGPTASWSWLQRLNATTPLLYTEEYLQ